MDFKFIIEYDHIIKQACAKNQHIWFTHRHSTPLAGKMGTKACHECKTLHIRPKLGGMGLKYYSTNYIQKLNKLDVW
jgi:hypothetical protein